MKIVCSCGKEIIFKIETKTQRLMFGHAEMINIGTMEGVTISSESPFVHEIHCKNCGSFYRIKQGVEQ